VRPGNAAGNPPNVPNFLDARWAPIVKCYSWRNASSGSRRVAR
jgi:hypothetical protein